MDMKQPTSSDEEPAKAEIINSFIKSLQDSIEF